MTLVLSNAAPAPIITFVFIITSWHHMLIIMVAYVHTYSMYICYLFCTLTRSYILDSGCDWSLSFHKTFGRNQILILLIIVKQQSLISPIISENLYQLNSFSNFSYMFLNPNNFFQFEF